MTPFVDALEAQTGQTLQFRDEVQRLAAERALVQLQKRSAEYDTFIATHLDQPPVAT